ncbi:MAG: rRNA maturation RNase YbeY [Erysipelotrichaceae bacterium]
MNFEYINQTNEKSWKNYRPYICQIVSRTITVLKLDKKYDFSIILVDSNTIQEINREYRKIDKVTDVISFASLDDESLMNMEDSVELGDIFINVQAIRDQAKDYGHSLKREFCFLVTHGILHLLGYDHLNVDDEKIMFDLQEEILNEIARR